MRTALFQPTAEGEARLLILIAAFSANNGSLEGRTKLAKLDFLIRYPPYFARALSARPNLSRNATVAVENARAEGQTIESRMVRYRYGPWDPAHFALLGRLVGKELVEPVAEKNGIGYRVTEKGRELAAAIASDEAWTTVAERAAFLKQYLDLTGYGLTQFIYKNIPEVADSTWGEIL